MQSTIRSPQSAVRSPASGRRTESTCNTRAVCTRSMTDEAWNHVASRSPSALRRQGCSGVCRDAGETFRQASSSALAGQGRAPGARWQAGQAHISLRNNCVTIFVLRPHARSVDDNQRPTARPPLPGQPPDSARSKTTAANKTNTNTNTNNNTNTGHGIGRGPGARVSPFTSSPLFPRRLAGTQWHHDLPWTSSV